MRTEHFGLALLIVPGLLAGCLPAGATYTKAEARSMGGRDPGGGDLCEAEGWYGDGECDVFCPEPDEDCASCPLAGARVRYASTDPGLCATLPIECEAGEMAFSDHCGCGCAAASCPAAGAGVRYASEDPSACAALLFTCDEGESAFSGACGCGCVAASCHAPGTPGVRYVGDPETCTRIDFACDEGEVIFGDECGCGCRAESCPAPGAPGVRYVSEDPAECATLFFACEEGETPFSGGCGCGCVAASCPPAGAPGVRYVSSDPLECAALLFTCEEGETPFSDECGCGCVSGVCALETRLEIVGGWLTGSRLVVSDCAHVAVSHFDEALCERTLPADAAVGPDEVRAALEHADVEAALASGVALFGVDASPVDGPVLEIERGGRSTRVGSPCGSASGCVPIPPGLQALVELAGALRDQEQAREACR